MKQVLTAAVFTLAGGLLVGQANAQCVLGLTSPLYALNGTTWAFQTEDGLAGDAAIGFFTAQVQTPARAGVPTGVLSVTQTSNAAGVITKATTSGLYQVSPDCSGGDLFFSGGNTSYHYSFVFANGGTQMLMVSDSTSTPNSSEGPYAGNRGVAILQAPPAGCAAGLGNSLNALAGKWSFLAQDYESASSGIFTASVGTPPRAAGPAGALSITETQSGLGSVIKTTIPGAYTVSADCSGGELFFEGAQVGYTYAFIFVNPNEIFMISDSTTPPNVTFGAFRGNHGTAVRY